LIGGGTYCGPDRSVEVTGDRKSVSSAHANDIGVVSQT
jgi:hypothetical protein